MKIKQYVLAFGKVWTNSCGLNMMNGSGEYYVTRLGSMDLKNGCKMKYIFKLEIPYWFNRRVVILLYRRGNELRLTIVLCGNMGYIGHPDEWGTKNWWHITLYKGKK